MNKKLMALAVAGALAAPVVAFAQTSSVQIYGRANLGLDNYSATGSTLGGNGAGGNSVGNGGPGLGSAGDYKSRYRIYDNSSRIGFRGTEDLGNGLRAIFLMESGVHVDNGYLQGQSGALDTSGGTLSSRIGYVGLEGNWGQLTFGRNNVWWANWAQEQTGANYINTSAPFFSGGFGRGMGVGVARQSNLLQYTSPTWSGFNAILSYSPNAQEAVQAPQACASLVAASTTTGSPTCSTQPAVGAPAASGFAGPGGATPNTDGSLWGITLNGAFGPIAGGYDYVVSKGNSPVANVGAFPVLGQPKTVGNKFRLGWTYMPGGQITILWVQSQITNGGAGGAYGGLPEAPSAAAPGGGAFSTSLKQQGWGLNWEHIFGNIQALAQYGKVSNITGCNQALGAGVTAAGVVVAAPNAPGACSGTNANIWLVGARYLMSKRTAAYVSWTQIKNDNNYNMDYNGGAITAAFTPAAAGATGLTGSLAGLPAGSVGADPRIWAVGIIHNF